MRLDTTNYSVIELLQMLDRKELTVNQDYQRGTGLWPNSASAYFIDTILEDFTFPKIYIYEYIDRSVRGPRREIVDGQQRINAIHRFYNDGFRLQGDGVNKGRLYSELDEDTQNCFLSYSVPIDVIRSASRAEILQMFRRMNAYTMPLNEAEKRHSAFHGSFKWFVNRVSDDLSEFFVEFKVFTTKQITRMADSTLISDVILAMEEGIVSTSPKQLENIYEKYNENFLDEDKYRIRIISAFDFIRDELEPLRGSFMMKPYALHSLIVALIHCKFGISKIETEFGIRSIGTFSNRLPDAIPELVAMAAAHEAKETSGPYRRYVWGCLSTTDRKARRTARLAALLRTLGATVPADVDANLT